MIAAAPSSGKIANISTLTRPPKPEPGHSDQNLVADGT
jgi:hypothetical protein